MPYANISDLPEPVRHHLPFPVQETFLAEFKSAWESYRGSDPAERERRAFRNAWAAVKRSYRKMDGEWVPKRLALALA
jgi:cation transport regulator